MIPQQNIGSSKFFVECAALCATTNSAAWRIACRRLASSIPRSASRHCLDRREISAAPSGFAMPPNTKSGLRRTRNFTKSTTRTVGRPLLMGNNLSETTSLCVRRATARRLKNAAQSRGEKKELFWLFSISKLTGEKWRCAHLRQHVLIRAFHHKSKQITEMKTKKRSA